MRPWLAFLAVVVAASPAFAAARVNDPEGLLKQANAAFQGGQYDVAAAEFEQLASAGFGTVDIFFNLGTSSLKAGRRGDAILAFERALRVDPNDSDASYNLEEALKGNIDKIVGTREEEPLLERIGARVPAETAGFAFLGAWVFGLLVLLARRYVRAGKGALAMSGGLALSVAVLAGLLLAAAAYHRSYATYAIVVTASSSVREGPASDFKAAFEIHEGLKVRVVSRDRDYLRIRLPNGAEGWVAAKDVPVI